MLILLHSHIFGDIGFLRYLTLSLTISLPNQHHSTPTLFHISIIMVQFKRTSQNRTSLTSLPSMYPANQQQWMPNSSHQQTSSLSGLKIALVALCLILPWIPYAAVRISFNTVESRVSSLLEQRQTLAQDLGRIMHGNNKLQEKEETMRDETGALFATLRKLGALDDYHQHEVIENNFLAEIDSMHASLQATSRRAIKEHYGIGSHRVAMHLESSNSHDSIVVVELADVRTMPLAVHMFLTMVEEHVAIPMIRHKGDLTVATNFKRTQTKPLVFSEPSSSSGKYSLCFKGSGPSFYISLQDNKTADEDPCFGTVVANQNLLDRLPDVTVSSRCNYCQKSERRLQQPLHCYWSILTRKF